MPNYEAVFVFQPELPESRLTELLTRLKNIISSHEGTLDVVDDWGKKRLAYPIQRYREGYYVLFRFSAAPGAVSEITKFVRTVDGIIRHIVIKQQKPSKPKKVRIGKRNSPPANEKVVSSPASAETRSV